MKTRTLFVLLLAAAMSAAAVRPAGATTIRYRTDAELVALAERVVHARVLTSRSEWTSDGTRIVTITRLAVIEDFTGRRDRVIEVRELGGRVGDVELFVAEGPTFEPGREVIVCLERDRDGQFRNVARAFSTFDVDATSSPGDLAAVTRDRSAAHAISAAGDPDSAPHTRTLAAFRRTVGAVKGVRPFRPVAAAATDEIGEASESYTFLGPARWNEADSGTAVRWYRSTYGAAPVTGSDGTAEIVTALAAWTNPLSASIALQYAGTTTEQGRGPFGGYGVITFEDPNGDVSSGALAIGGGWFTSSGGLTVNGQLFRRFISAFVIFQRASLISSGLRTPTNFARIVEHEVGHTIGLGHSGAGSANIMYYACCSSSTPVPPAIGPDDLAGIEFIYPPPPPPPDADADGLPDAWEVQFGLHPHAVPGVDGPLGDADGDGRTNLQEYLDGTHPRGTYTRYFAEGASGSFFDCRLALVNPSATTAVNVLLRFLKRDLTTTSRYVQVPPRERRTVVARDVPGVSTAEFSTVVEADGVVVADRTMSWDGSGYGSHAETSLAGPSTVWYLAEGATHWNFDLYYTIQNPSLTTDAVLEVTYLRPAPLPPVVRPYVVARNSRYNIWVDGEGAELAATDVSAQLVVTNGVPVIVERSMYLTTPGQFWGAGHNAAGVTAPALDWFLAEGATGTYFNMYVLLANPQATAAVVDVTYMPEGAAAFTKRYTVAARSRANIAVNGEDARLANAAVSTAVHVVNGVPIIVERSMWWPGPGAGTWREAHASAGLTTTGTGWALAEGENGGPANTQTYVLIANTSAYAGTVEVTLVFEDGTPAVTRSLAVGANSRRTIFPPAEFGAQVPAGTYKRFGVVVESVGTTPAQLVVERAMYSDAGGESWAAGTNAVATRLR